MDKGEKYTDEQIEEMESETHKIYEETLAALIIAVRPILSRLKQLNDKGGTIAQRMLLKPSERDFSRYVSIIIDGNKKTSENINFRIELIKNFNAKYQWDKIPFMGGVDRELYNRTDFENVLKNIKNMFPATLDRKKDELWNSKKMKSIITRLLNEGSSIPEFSKELANVVGANESATVMRARSVATMAQNKSRLDALKYAEKRFGVKYVKIWDNSHDNRVRESHVRVNGERRALDEKFSNGLLYPGQSGSPWKEIANCRCSLKSERVR